MLPLALLNSTHSYSLTETKMEISERYAIDVAADRCTIVPILGCLTTIPRMLFSFIIGCGTCMCTCYSKNPKYRYIINRAHMECCRGLWESIPFGILCIDQQIENQERLGVGSKNNYGKFKYQDPATGNVFYSSESNIRVVGWADYDDVDNNSSCCCECLWPIEIPVTRSLTEHETISLENIYGIFINMNTTSNQPRCDHEITSRTISLSENQKIAINAILASPPRVENMQLPQPTEITIHG